ncbi:hypothetical protein BpHYR1_037383 [Brachionus plicatilis]|uniref:EB domain-containing protein n=1 Tax=Brachionus plicatilis TaxID=10195 RepID=A0A3M7QI92_BRAPC|nr:hypothetical protein BpHYR1_037383 [Brachionus plicatilis]
MKCSSTHYWSHFDITCKLKEINGTWCTYSLQCQTENGLSCITNRCFCAENHYWSGTQCLWEFIKWNPNKDES